METTSITSTNSAQTGVASGPTTEAPDAADALSSDFETFLVLLTAQLNNQDPLNPVDSQDFATQLATFSGVEQQVKTNDLLTSLTQTMNLSSLADMAGWVGMEARVSGAVQFSGTPIEIYPQLPSFAETAQLVVSNAQGAEVQRINIPVSEDPIEWAGTFPDGTPIPSGAYSLTVEAFSQNELVNVGSVEHFAEVSEVRATDTGSLVVLQGGATVAATEVTGLRQPA
ncbi:MAG: flagellar hook capping FlgD N-terminal domain-containing protein [Pseudomonadota bacterium]